MLDKKAQESLLENAVAVNEIILGAAVKHYVQLQEGLKKAKEADKTTGDGFHEKLFQTANESQVTDMAKLIEMYGEPDDGSTTKDPKFVVKKEIKESIKEIQDLMEQRKIDDEAVEEKLKIATAATSAASASTATVIPTTTFTDYYKSDWDVTYWYESGVFSMVLPIFKEDDSTNLVINFTDSSKEIKYEFMSDDDVRNHLGSQVTSKTTYQEEIDAIEKTDKYKEWKNATSYFKSATEINAQMETDEKFAFAKIAELNTILALKETALTITTDATKAAELKAEIQKIKTESLPAENLKVDQKTISDDFKKDLKSSEADGKDWFASLLTNATAFKKADLFKDNKIKKVFTMGPNGKDLNPLNEKRASPLWFISSSINGPLGNSFLNNNNVKKVIKDKIQKGDKFYSIETGEQFKTFAAFLNFDKAGPV